MSAYELRLQYICPLCKRRLEVTVDRRELSRAPGGIYSVPIIHGDPSHILLLYVDRNGLIRGADVFNTIVDMSFKVPFDDIINIVGEDLLAKILAATTSYANIYLKVDEDTAKTLQTFLRGIFKGEFIQIVDRNKATYVLDKIRKKYSKVIGEKYFKKILQDCKKLNSDRAKILKLSSAVKLIRDRLNMAIDILSKRKVLAKEFQVELGLNKEEFEILIQALKNRYPHLMKNVAFGLFDLF